MLGYFMDNGWSFDVTLSPSLRGLLKRIFTANPKTFERYRAYLGEMANAGKWGGDHFSHVDVDVEDSATQHPVKADAYVAICSIATASKILRSINDTLVVGRMNAAFGVKNDEQDRHRKPVPIVLMVTTTREQVSNGFTESDLARLHKAGATVFYVGGHTMGGGGINSEQFPFGIAVKAIAKELSIPSWLPQDAAVPERTFSPAEAGPNFKFLRETQPQQGFYVVDYSLSATPTFGLT